MTDLVTIALEFAREVLEWEDATNVSETGRVYPKVCWSPARRLDLRFTDSNVVMVAVQGWCDEHEGAIEIRYFGYVPSEWEVDVSTPHGIDSITCDDLCHALMAACLMASRKLKAAA